MQIETMGIVIRERSVGNDDRLLTLLTRDRGVLTAFARGAKKPRGRLTSSTELFCYSRLTLFFYRDTYTVDAAEPEVSFFELRQDLTALSLASYIAELCGELAPKEEEAGEYLRLVLNCLHLLKTKGKSPPLIKALFELRLMMMAGFMPDLIACAECGVFEGDGMALSIESSELFCGKCAVKQPQAIRVSTGVLAAMRHILYSELDRLFSFSLSPQASAELGNVCEEYLRYHVQQVFPSLDFYHSIAEG